MFKGNIAFIREALADFEKTGALFSTSQWAAKELARPLRKRDGPLRILELGPGNGSVTTEILKSMIDGDTLDICEINPRFMRELKRRLRRSPRFRARRSQIRFFTCAAQELPELTTYDVIICAIPFLNFDRKTVEEIFTKIKKLSNRGAVLTYYEYIGIRPISKMFSPPKRKARMKELDLFFHDFSQQHATKRRHVWLNVLPINIYNVQIAA